jgi:RNA polymerase sigma factor (TIGR02999 family)
MSSEPSVTALLERMRRGDAEARDELIPLVFDELHRLARNAFRQEDPGHTLQPTALVNEAFLRLFSGRVPQFIDRAHFLGIASRVMRQILVDHARTRRALKRGSGARIQLHESIAAAKPLEDLLELDEALGKLGNEDDKLVVMIEMRFFGGMTAEEISEVRSESVHVIRHNLRYAQARLRQILQDGSAPAV